jgi:hypothetical protein
MSQIIAPLRVFYDKSYYYLCNYFHNFFYANNKNNNINRIYERISTYKQIISFFKPPTYIIDNIYLGNARHAASYDTLVDMKIGMIINVTNEITSYYPDTFTYYKYSLSDNNLDSIKVYIKNAYEKILYYQKKNPDMNILIHCFMGASRSVSVILFYLIKTMKNEDGSCFNIDQALEFIKTKRDVVNPTEKFISELNEIILSD